MNPIQGGYSALWLLSGQRKDRGLKGPRLGEAGKQPRYSYSILCLRSGGLP